MPTELLRLPQFRRRIGAVAPALMIALVVLFAAACSGGARPTITTDRLQESAAVAPTATADSPNVDPVDGAQSGDGTVAAVPDSYSAPDPLVVEELVVQVLDTFAHDATAFTQGLELDNGTFIESTGLRGESDLRRVVPATGEVIQQVATPNDFFAEGVTKVGEQLIQLTWQENTAFYWNATSFELEKEVAYPGEGWGLCYDGSRLVMTDGSSSLIFRDPTTFDETGRITVALNNQEVFNLNEVECVNGMVWANIWQTDLIVRIDPATGNVTATVDASSLDSPAGVGGAVLNGIAWDDSTQSFYVTGKLWPTMYRVNFVPVGG